jgi:flagellar hook-basal body complex protein FliE
MATPLQNINQAAAAYLDAAKGKEPGLEARDRRPSGEFAELVKGVIEKSIDNGQTGERQSMEAVNDRADLNQVVTAVAEAELTLQTVMAVRDKVMEAYREILRMPI